jgi:hypothetical protein
MSCSLIVANRIGGIPPKVFRNYGGFIERRYAATSAQSQVSRMRRLLGCSETLQFSVHLYRPGLMLLPTHGRAHCTSPIIVGCSQRSRQVVEQKHARPRPISPVAVTR